MKLPLVESLLAITCLTLFVMVEGSTNGLGSVENDEQEDSKTIVGFGEKKPKMRTTNLSHNDDNESKDNPSTLNKWDSFHKVLGEVDDGTSDQLNFTKENNNSNTNQSLDFNYEDNTDFQLSDSENLEEKSSTSNTVKTNYGSGEWGIAEAEDGGPDSDNNDDDNDKGGESQDENKNKDNLKDQEKDEEDDDNDEGDNSNNDDGKTHKENEDESDWNDQEKDDENEDVTNASDSSYSDSDSNENELFEKSSLKKGFFCPTVKFIGKFGMLVMAVMMGVGVCWFGTDPESFLILVENILNVGRNLAGSQVPNLQNLVNWLAENTGRTIANEICFIAQVKPPYCSEELPALTNDVSRICYENGYCLDVFLKKAGEFCIKAVLDN